MTRLAVCPGCRTTHGVRTDGRIRRHWLPNRPRVLGYPRCSGSGRDTTGWRTRTHGGRDVLVPPGRPA